MQAHGGGQWGPGPTHGPHFPIGPAGSRAAWQGPLAIEWHCPFCLLVKKKEGDTDLIGWCPYLFASEEAWAIGGHLP